METQTSTFESINKFENNDLASWNRQRSAEELNSFISRRALAIAELSE